MSGGASAGVGIPVREPSRGKPGPIFILDEGNLPSCLDTKGVWGASAMDSEELFRSMSRDAILISADRLGKTVNAMSPAEMSYTVLVPGGHAFLMAFELWKREADHPFLNALRMADRYIAFCAGSGVAAKGIVTKDRPYDHEPNMQAELLEVPIYDAKVRTPGFVPLASGVMALTASSLAFQYESIRRNMTALEFYGSGDHGYTDVAAMSVESRITEKAALPACLLYGYHPEATAVTGHCVNALGLEWDEEYRVAAHEKATLQIREFLEAPVAPGV